MADSMYYGRLFMPLAINMGVAFVTPSMKREGGSMPQRPPAWVFGVIWPALYLGLGYAWAESAEIDALEADVLYGVITGLLVLWLIVVAGWLGKNGPGIKNNRASLWVMMLIIAASLTGLSRSPDILSSISLGGLTGWLILAQHYNYHLIGKVE